MERWNNTVNNKAGNIGIIKYEMKKKNREKINTYEE
jgi:hypothetical protein